MNMEFSKEERDAALRAVWWSLHTQAYNSMTKELAQNFEQAVLRPVIGNLFCDKCRYHGTKYMDNIPYSAFKHIQDEYGRYIGPFLYVHKFHNTVNERIGKPLMPWDEALEIFDSQRITCSGGCELGLQEITPPPEQPSILNLNNSGSYSSITTTQSSKLDWLSDSRDVHLDNGKLIFRRRN